MNTTERINAREIKNLEQSLRRKAYRRGYIISKCRGGWNHPSHGTYCLADFNNHAVLCDNNGYGESLESIAEFLNDK